jgi:hypothetical protein
MVSLVEIVVEDAQQIVLLSARTPTTVLQCSSMFHWCSPKIENISVSQTVPGGSPPPTLEGPSTCQLSLPKISCEYSNPSAAC